MLREGVGNEGKNEQWCDSFQTADKDLTKEANGAGLWKDEGQQGACNYPNRNPFDKIGAIPSRKNSMKYSRSLSKINCFPLYARGRIKSMFFSIRYAE